MNNEAINITQSKDNRMHELTMLYLEKNVPTNITTDALAKLYVDSYYNISNSVNSYKRVTQPTFR